MMRQTVRQYQALRSYGTTKGKPAKRVLSFGKIDTRSRVPKDAHLRSGDHLALVRRQPCIILRRSYFRFERGGQWWGASVVAHHPDEIVPDSICAGRRCSDYLAVPLLAHLHDGFPDSLHATNSASWWHARGVDPLQWIIDFLSQHYGKSHDGASFAIECVRRHQERNTS